MAEMGNGQEQKVTKAEIEAVKQVWEKARKIIAERPARRRKNSRSPEIWQRLQIEQEAKTLRWQLESLAREIGIEPDF